MKSFQPHATVSRSRVELTADFNSPVTNRVLEYWNSVRGTRPRPRLRDIDLMDIYEVAPTVIIRDMIDGGEEFLCRYWGTELVQFFGFDGTGKLLADCYSPASAAVLRRRMMMAIENDLPVRVAGVTDLVDTDMPRTYEGIWLAILDEDDAAVHALAAFDTGYGLTPADEARHAEAENVDAIEYPDT